MFTTRKQVCLYKYQKYKCSIITECTNLLNALFTRQEYSIISFTALSMCQFHILM